MGNDGGSIPTRRELVKESARNPTASELKATTQEHLAHAWRTCALSGETLKQPVVSDALGRLFNKEEVIKAILPVDDSNEDDVNKKEKDECLKKAEIKGLKDVVELKFEVEDSNETRDSSRWVCPITRKELNERTRAVYLVPCGHAFAEVAIREVGEQQCPQCGEAFAPNDQVPILSTDETEIARLTLRMQTLKDRGLTHALKKVKKSKKTADGDVKADGETKHKSQKTKSNGIQNAATASITAKVLEEQEVRNKKRKAEQGGNLDSLYSKDAAPGAKKGKNNDFMSRGFSIPAHQR